MSAAPIMLALWCQLQETLGSVPKLQTKSPMSLFQLEKLSSPTEKHTHAGSTCGNHVALTFDLSSSGSMCAKRLPWTLCLQSSVLIAQAIFLFTEQTLRHTDTQTQSQTPLMTLSMQQWLPTWVMIVMSANLGNKCLAISRRPGEQYTTMPSTLRSVRMRIFYWPLQQHNCQLLLSSLTNWSDNSDA